MKVSMTISQLPGKKNTGPVKSAPKKTGRIPTRTELVNAKKAADGHRKLEADHLKAAENPIATSKDKKDVFDINTLTPEQHKAMASTHKNAAEYHEAILARAPKKGPAKSS